MKTPGSRVHPLFLGLLGILVLLWISFFVYREILQFRLASASRIPTAEGIDSLEKVRLGGVDQWILLRGWDRSDPVVLFLHGGPGAPLFPHARDIGVGAGLEEQSVMVYWEQRGTGKSFHFSIPDSSMTVDQLVSDTRDLVHILRKRLGVNRVILVGKSWGSLIGILTVHRFPNLFDAYVGIGQVVSPLAGDSLSYRFTLETARNLGHRKALAELAEIGPPPYTPSELRIQRGWLTRFDRRVMEHQGKHSDDRPGARRRLLATPEYSFLDIVKMGTDPFFSTRHLWNQEFYAMDLVRQVPRLEVPVYFVTGRHDHFTPGTLVEAYYDTW